MRLTDCQHTYRPSTPSTPAFWQPSCAVCSPHAVHVPTHPSNASIMERGGALPAMHTRLMYRSFRLCLFTCSSRLSHTVGTPAETRTSTHASMTVHPTSATRRNNLQLDHRAASSTPHTAPDPHRAHCTPKQQQLVRATYVCLHPTCADGDLVCVHESIDVFSIKEGTRQHHARTNHGPCSRTRPRQSSAQREAAATQSTHVCTDSEACW